MTVRHLEISSCKLALRSKQKKKKNKQQHCKDLLRWEGAGGGRQLPGPPVERWGGTAVAILPVVLVALVQVGPADVPVDDLVHCNTRRWRRQNPLVIWENSSETPESLDVLAGRSFPHKHQKTSTLFRQP